MITYHYKMQFTIKDFCDIFEQNEQYDKIMDAIIKKVCGERATVEESIITIVRLVNNEQTHISLKDILRSCGCYIVYRVMITQDDSKTYDDIKNKMMNYWNRGINELERMTDS